MQCYPFFHSDDQSAEPATDLRLIRAADCPAQDVEWLWPQKIPLGKVTLLVGDPGTGKSLVALDIAARLSRARSWPDFDERAGRRTTLSDEVRVGEKENGRGGESIDTRINPQPPISPSPSLPVSPSSTLILSATDDLADTIRPRLDAAGADPRRVFAIPSISDLRHDLNQLRAAINQVPNCRLIIVDPINAYVGAGDSHFQTVVQKVLAPLAELAAEKRIAVLAIAHHRKTNGAAIHRAAGSMGFVAAARAVWTVCRDPDNPQRHLLLPLKNNLTPTAAGLAYAIHLTGGANAPTINWQPTPIKETAEVILAPKKRGPQAVELEDASDWLRKALAEGPRSADELTRRAEQFGFHERTLRRALHAIGGDTQLGNPLDGWRWSLPGDPTVDCANNPAAPGSAEGLCDPDNASTSIKEADASQDTFSMPTDSDPILVSQPAPYPQALTPKKPVPSPKTCPLPRNIEGAPLRTGRFSDQSRTTRKSKRRPKRTGNPILDMLLDTLRQPLPDNHERETQPTVANTS